MPPHKRERLIAGSQHYGLRWRIQDAWNEGRRLLESGKGLGFVKEDKYTHLRKAIGLTVNELAGTTGLGERTIRNLEEGLNSERETLDAYFQALLARIEAVQIIPGRLPKWIDLPIKAWNPESFGASDLLDPEFHVVDFHGGDRRKQVSDLVDWCGSGEALGIISVTAIAGMGKTRLAIELCSKLRKMSGGEESPNWLAGFLMPDQFPQEGGGFDGVDLTGRNLLIVVDYAGSAESLKVLKRLLPGALALGRRELRPKRLRILLLDRTDMWIGLLKRDKDCGAVFGAPEFKRSFSESDLKSAVDDGNRLAVYNLAAAAFRQRLDPEAKLALAGGLDAPEFERLLLIHMAALFSVGREKPFRLSESEILEAMLNRERRQWERALTVKELPVHFLSILESVYHRVSSVGGARTIAEASQLALEIRAFKGVDVHLQDQILDVLHRCYASSRAFIQPMRPDFLGEFFAVHPARKK